MIDRTNLPDFFHDMPEERLKELMDVVMTIAKISTRLWIRYSIKTRRKRQKARQGLNPAFPTISIQ